MNKEEIMIKVGELFNITDKLESIGSSFETTGNSHVAESIYSIKVDMDNKLTKLSLLLDLD